MRRAASVASLAATIALSNAAPSPARAARTFDQTAYVRAQRLYLQAAIARTTRACSYDRAGMGYSDPGPLPRTSAAVVSDLHRLLAAARIPPPYVPRRPFVRRLQCAVVRRHVPRDVAGMSLVDPSHEDQLARFRAVTPAIEALENGQAALMARCLRGLEPGGSGMPPRSKPYADCVGDTPAGYGPALAAATVRLAERRA